MECNYWGRFFPTQKEPLPGSLLPGGVDLNIWLWDQTGPPVNARPQQLGKGVNILRRPKNGAVPLEIDHGAVAVPG